MNGEQLSEQDRRLLLAIERGLGDTCLTALRDDLVEEVILNADGRIWICKAGVGKYDSGQTMLASNALNLMRTIAAFHQRTVDDQKPVLECNLPIGTARFAGVVPPVSAGPAFNIRKRAIKVYELEDYVKEGILRPPHYQAILEGVRERKNILVVGGTGSGKTTLLNAVVAACARHTPDHRVVVIEDTGEIQCAAQDKLVVQTTINVSMLDLLRAALRWRPDRIIVGEVRGPEANAMLKAWNTGHPGGVATIHANDCRGGLIRLEQLIQEGVSVVNPAVIAEAVDLIVFIEKRREDGKRVVQQVVRVKGYDTAHNEYVLEAA